MNNPFDAIAHKPKTKVKKKRPKKVLLKDYTDSHTGLELMLARKEQEWNDDEYEAGKDW